MRLSPVVFSLLSIGLVDSVAAHCMHNKFYGGAGVGFNTVNGFSDSAGFQIFGGYCLDAHLNNPKTRAQFEVGYWDSGELERSVNTTTTTSTTPGSGGDDDEGGPTTTLTSTRSDLESKSLAGLWVSGIGEFKISGVTHLLGRIGVDLGDDNGILGGFGVGLNFTKWAQFRGEYIVRNETESLQISWLSEFN